MTPAIKDAREAVAATVAASVFEAPTAAQDGPQVGASYRFFLLQVVLLTLPGGVLQGGQALRVRVLPEVHEEEAHAGPAPR